MRSNGGAAPFISFFSRFCVGQKFPVVSTVSMRHVVPSVGLFLDIQTALYTNYIRRMYYNTQLLSLQ